MSHWACAFGSTCHYPFSLFTSIYPFSFSLCFLKYKKILMETCKYILHICIFLLNSLIWATQRKKNGGSKNIELTLYYPHIFLFVYGITIDIMMKLCTNILHITLIFCILKQMLFNFQMCSTGSISTIWDNNQTMSVQWKSHAMNI
jgi:hypothetical protein